MSFERRGYAREVAERWWFAMGGLSPAPATVDAALRRRNELGVVLAIRTERKGKFWNVVERQVRRSNDCVVDITRSLRCIVANSREAAAGKPIAIDDEVPF
jgi:hypothetical protein